MFILKKFPEFLIVPLVKMAREDEEKLPPIGDPRKMEEDEKSDPSFDKKHKFEDEEAKKEEDIQKEENKEEFKKEKEEKVTDKEVVKDEAYWRKLGEEKINEELQHTMKDNFYTKIMVQKPWIIMTSTCVIIFLFTVICIALGGFELTDETTRDYLLWDSSLVQDWDKFELAKEALQTNYPDEVQPLRVSTEDTWTTSITFECSD